MLKYALSKGTVLMTPRSHQDQRGRRGETGLRRHQLKGQAQERDLLAEKSFGAKDMDDDTEEEAETKGGTSAEQGKPLTDNTNSAERPDIVEGDATGEDDQGQASIFRHARDQGDDEKRAIDKADEEDVKMILVRKKKSKVC